MEGSIEQEPHDRLTDEARSLTVPLPFSGSFRPERMVSTAFSTSSLLQTLSWMVRSRSLFKLSSSLTPASPLSWGRRDCSHLCLSLPGEGSGFRTQPNRD